MTRIKYRESPVWHESDAVQDGRKILIAEQPHALLLRLKGTREVLTLPLSAAYLKAAQAEAASHVTRRTHTVRRGALV